MKRRGASIARRPLGSWTIRACAALGVAGCVNRAELAAELNQAASQPSLPKVVACWERAFEDAGFYGAYVASVDFTVRPRSGDIDEAVIRELVSADTGEPADHDSLRRCLVAALNDSSLGPAGFRPSQTIHVRGYRLSFTDATRSDREAASAASPTLLIGPRADRCQGLYGHEPPREIAELLQELSEAQADAAAYASEDRDRHARALQRTYDLALELAQRLDRELLRHDLERDSKSRIREELARAQALAREVGRRIGCK